MKPTATQWLLKILEGQKDKPFNYDEWKIAFEHALEMEKEQIKDAWDNGCEDDGIIDNAEQYYNEMFKPE